MPAATRTLLVFAVALAGRVAAASGRDLGISAREVLGEASRSMQERSRCIQRGILHGLGRSGPDLGEHSERGRSLSPASSAERLVAVAAVVENLALFKRWKFKQRSQLEMEVSPMSSPSLCLNDPIRHDKPVEVSDFNSLGIFRATSRLMDVVAAVLVVARILLPSIAVKFFAEVPS